MKEKYLIYLSLVFILFMFSGCRHNEPESATAAVTSETESSIQELSEIPPEPSPEPSLPPEPKKATEEDLKIIQDYESKYFVKKLSDENKYHFTELYSAAMKFEQSAVFFTPVTDSELTTLMFLLNYDCPELIQLSGDYFPEYNENGQVTQVTFSYCMEQKDYEPAVKKLEDFRKTLLQKAEGKSEYETEKMVYDLIFDHAVYNESLPMAGSVYSTLINNVGRCEGFSKSFTWCMRKLGYECLGMLGKQEWDKTAIYPNHSWNIVKIEGKYYHVDITVDNVQSNTEIYNPPNYGFLNTSDEMTYDKRQVSKVFTDLGIPECTSSDLNYHILNGLYIKKGENIQEKITGLLNSHYTTEGIHALSIKFEDPTEYQNTVNIINSIVRNYLQQYPELTYSFITYQNALSHTFIINASLISQGG